MDWLDRIIDARNHLVASPWFQRWAAAFPLTRPIARRHARDVFDLCAGFVYSQILLACVRLGVLERLRDGPAELQAIMAHTGLAHDRAHQLMEAATALGLAVRRGRHSYALGMQGAALLGNPGILRMIDHHELLYRDLADPIGLLKGDGAPTSLSKYWAYVGAGDRATLTAADVGAYTTLMSRSQSLVTSEILDSAPLERFTSLLDVGGGEGIFLAAAGRRHAHLRLALFDLPPVAERARAFLASEGLADRSEVHGGDFLLQSLPTGADVVSLVRVLHDHSDSVAKKLLASVRRTLPGHGALIIAEPLAATSSAVRMGHAYFGFYLMAMGSGRPRTLAEIRGLLAAAGFARSRSIGTRLPLQTSVIVAYCS
jgi:demethylspheroidene O-methyltransferase